MMSSQKFIKFTSPSILWIITVILFLGDTTAYISTTRIAGLYSIAYVTVPSPEIARNISVGAVTKKLAASVNIIPEIKSVYEWRNKVHEDPEIIMLIKTRTSRISDLIDFIKKEHPFDICEVITVQIANGNPSYLNWILEQVPESTSLTY